MRQFFKVFLIIALIFYFGFPNQSFLIKKAKAAEVTVNVSDTSLPNGNTGIGTNVDPINIDYRQAFYSANMLANPSFEDRWYPNTRTDSPTTLQANVSSPWWITSANWNEIISDKVTASVDTTQKVSGSSSQKIHIDSTFLSDVKLGHWSIPPLVAGHTYRAKAQVKGSSGGAVRLWFKTGSGIYSNPLTLNNNWQTITLDYTPVSDAPIGEVVLSISARGDIWADDFIFWDATDTTSEGLSKSMVDNLKALQPKILRWGSLFGNELTLPRATFRPWNLSYGPPPDFDIASFLEVARLVGAKAYITIPPSFNSPNFQTNVLPQLETAWDNVNQYGCVAPYNTQLAGLIDQVENTFDEHMQLLDYIGGDPFGTHYGTENYAAIRQSQGFGPWDSNKVSHIYFELGNELWNSRSKPYYMWDCYDFGKNYGHYVLNRTSAMKNYANWKNGYYEIGFNGHWVPGNSFDKDTALVIGQAGLAPDKSLDFFSDTIYVPYPADITTTTTDEQYYSALMAGGTFRLPQLITRKNEVNLAVGKTLKWITYESAAELGQKQDNRGNSPEAYKAHSVGATVALIDTYAKMQNAGIDEINYYTAIGEPNRIYGVTYGYPNYQKLVQYYGFKMFNSLPSIRLQTTSTGGGTWNDGLLPLNNIPYVEGYGYKSSDNNFYSALIINRDRTNQHSVQINFPAKNYNTTAELTTLSSPNIIDNNDTTADSVTPLTSSPTISGSSYSFTANPFSAYILKVAVNGAPAITLRKQADKTSVSSGGTITYTISYQNVSTTAVSNVKIEDNIPSGTTYVAGSAKLNNVAKTDAQDTDEFYFDGTKGTWTLGNLFSNATGNVSFQVRVN